MVKANMVIHDSGMLATALAAPTWWSGWPLIDHSMGLWPLAAIAVLVAYYVVVFRVILPVHPAGTIVPRYQPPNFVSPAMLRFLRCRTFDERAFAAAVLDLAARGYMEIHGGNKKPYTFSRVQDDDSMLPTDEIALAASLFHAGPVLRIDLDASEALQQVKKTMAMCMESLAAPYFRSSRRFVFGGVALTFGLLLPLIARTPLWPVALFACAVLTAFGSLMASAGLSAMRDIRHYLQRRSVFGILMAFTESEGLIGACVLALFCAVLVVALARFLSVTFGFFVLTAMVINIWAFCRPKVLSWRGRELQDDAEGFKQFLATAEADKLNRLSDGVNAPIMISEILPYALAFDLEHRWASQKFAHAFGFAGGEFVSTNQIEPGNLLPHGTKLPGLSELLSLASFLTLHSASEAELQSQKTGGRQS